MPPTQNDVKQGSPTTTSATFLEKMQDFSLVLGGPIFQVLRKVHLSGDHLELQKRRLIAITLFAWLPLLILCELSAGGATGRLLFLQDVEVQARFLVALPILIAAELIVHWRIRPLVRRFVNSGIVRTEDRPRFEAAIDSAIRLRNSIPVEIGLLIAVYTLGLWIWNSRVEINSQTWYAMPGGRWHLT